MLLFSDEFQVAISSNGLLYLLINRFSLIPQNSEFFPKVKSRQIYCVVGSSMLTNSNLCARHIIIRFWTSQCASRDRLPEMATIVPKSPLTTQVTTSPICVVLTGPNEFNVGHPLGFDPI